MAPSHSSLNTTVRPHFKALHLVFLCLKCSVLPPLLSSVLWLKCHLLCETLSDHPILNCNTLSELPIPVLCFFIFLPNTCHYLAYCIFYPCGYILSLPMYANSMKSGIFISLRLCPSSSNSMCQIQNRHPIYILKEWKNDWMSEFHTYPLHI